MPQSAAPLLPIGEKCGLVARGYLFYGSPLLNLRSQLNSGRSWIDPSLANPNTRPLKLDTLPKKSLLKPIQELLVSADTLWRLLCLERMRGEHSGGFSDVPFDWVQPVAAIRDVRCAEILARGKKVFDPFRNQ